MNLQAFEKPLQPSRPGKAPGRDHCSARRSPLSKTPCTVPCRFGIGDGQGSDCGAPRVRRPRARHLPDPGCGHRRDRTEPSHAGFGIWRPVDLVGACRAFVSVSEHGSFTVGAAAARMSQPVASRRVAALERNLGERLFERTSRRAVLTPFGRDMLPAARQLVRGRRAATRGGSAQAQAVAARGARHLLHRPVSPASSPRRAGAGVTLDLRGRGTGRAGRARPSAAGARRLARGAAGRATWSVPLGLAGADGAR